MFVYNFVGVLFVVFGLLNLVIVGVVMVFFSVSVVINVLLLWRWKGCVC